MSFFGVGYALISSPRLTCMKHLDVSLFYFRASPLQQFLLSAQRFGFEQMILLEHLSLTLTMKFSTPFITSTFSATDILAAPLTARRRAPNEARRLQGAGAPSTQYYDSPSYKTGTHEAIHFNEITQVDYSLVY